MPHRISAIAAFCAAALAAGAFAAAPLESASLANPRFTDVAKIPDLAPAAAKGLAAFRALAADGDTYKDLGLPDAASAGKAALGTPERDFLIRLDALKAYKPGSDPEALLTDTRIIHYPLVVVGKAVSTLDLQNAKGAWAVVGTGDAQRTALRKRAVDASVRRFAKAEADHFIVRIPALNMEFTAFRDANGALQLASVADNPLAGLVAGEAEPATKVLARVQPMALEDDGLPH
jgi:hypothetical protein